jgi:hypothetical protein
MTVEHKALAKKLSDPKRLAKLLEALRNNRPAWTMGIQEPEELILETLEYMGVKV